MVDYKVLITTSGLGSRLGSLTDYTNKCLVRVADKPTISYIIEMYPKDTKFVITLGHFGSHVKQFLQLAYPDYNFTFIEVDKYKGEGSSLGYSILQCKHELNCPFIFHASDTIVKGFEIPKLDKNWIVGSYKKDSSQYRTLNLNEGKLVKINEKGELGFDFSYIGLAGIKNHGLFFYNLEKLIYGDHKDTSDVHVINNMLPEVDFYYKEATHGSWFDIGNTSELTKTRKAFKSNIEVLDKKDESIFFFDDFVIKFFSNSTINKNRVTRAYNLGKLVPEILDSTENFYKYKKAEGALFSKSVNRNKFISFLNWSKDNLWIPKNDPQFNDKCYDFYINKTKSRIAQYLENNVEYDIINGEHIPSIYDLIDIIDVNWLCNGAIPSQFHGDFILDNIIETQDGFSLIDWRQDFAGDLEIGDMYYDLAKLNHNLAINHDIVNKNLFNHSADNCYILINSKLNECKGALHSFIEENNYDLKKVKLLTAIIWINMAPLHEYPFSNFLFNFGKYNLYKNLKLWHHNTL
jgi:NDP-sugar pyrophosphorylase family protein